MTLMFDLDLDITKTYLRIKDEVCNVTAFNSYSPNRTDRQTHTDATERITTSHSRTVKYCTIVVVFSLHNYKTDNSVTVQYL